ncbi:MAG: LacI family DNA-binding transcriptional regulator, partial [Emcibacteraceae bacterium]|nr:LacI family DNA-binding transcriptional regulator [Emcibacteraceae bacterium]
MATIRDVSKLAGVSVATVSRTLTKPDKVSVKTKKKVQHAIEQTNYKPDVLARNFRTRKSSTIVVLVPDIAN